jgi:hypothetical protein
MSTLLLNQYRSLKIRLLTLHCSGIPALLHLMLTSATLHETTPVLLLMLGCSDTGLVFLFMTTGTTMNERIKLLAEQAGFTEGGYESDDGPWIGPEFDKEKFAELIIAECIAAHEDDYGIDIIGDVLKKHFGVEQ